MKRLLLLAALLAVVFTPAVAQADNINVGDTVYIMDHPDANFGNGGAFILKTASGDQFTTFCVETNEFLASLPGNHVIGGISDKAINGGSGGGNPDPLDAKTAFLYYQFRSGNASYQNTQVLQNVIWFIEQEYGSLDGALANTYYNNAVTAVNGSWGNTIGPVGVINLLKPDGSRSQDLLTVVPDGGATLMLLGGALMGLGVLRRKFRS